MEVCLSASAVPDRTGVPLILEARPESGAEGPSYAIPVHSEDGYNAEVFYNTEVCGFRVDAAAPEDLVEPIGRLLRRLTIGGRLPTYVFIARRSRQIYPVYTAGDEVVATTPGGPVFRHVELAKVRARLMDYLHAVGELGAPGRSDRLHVRGVSERSLSLVRPLFYLKKRVATAGDHDFWAPVFPSTDGHAIYAYAASGRREVDLAEGHEVLVLRRQVAQALLADGRLDQDEDLRVDRLPLATVGRIQRHLEMTDRVLSAGSHVFPVFRGGRHLIVIEPREREDRCGLHLGTDPSDLLKRMADVLVRRGTLAHSDQLVWA